MPVSSVLDGAAGVRPEPERDPSEPLTDHIIELRRRLVFCLAYWCAGTVLCYGASGKLLTWLARSAGGVVFTLPTEAFMVRLKTAAFTGLLASLPLILHQVWLFVARAFSPGLRRLAFGLAAASYILFALGAALAMFVVVPSAMRFLLAFGSEEIRPLMTLSGYLGFVTGLALAFGAVFQMPIVLVLLNRLGIVSRRTLRERWRFVYLGAFVVAGALTPPDVFSQIALAVPTIVVFELTLLALR
ncbi:MAG: twin-arginine translocase subunit TatC [Elusimicrobia bacterium]|nr:twin-arginine translocase subunit TatC [Elusimicrobiota bacterium]